MDDPKVVRGSFCFRQLLGGVVHHKPTCRCAERPPDLISREAVREKLAPWVKKLDECLEDDEPLTEGYVLGLYNDLSSLLASLGMETP